jgi:uncharacterized protein (DUF2237 family)
MSYTVEYILDEENQKGLVNITKDDSKMLGFIVDGNAETAGVDVQIHAAMYADFADFNNVQRFADLIVANPSTAMITYYNTRPI